jgi:uncharacterized protein HemY
MRTLTHSHVGVMMVIFGLLVFLIAPYGVYHYRDQATKRADSYITEHLRDYNSGDFSRALNGYLAETRVERAAFYVVQFGGLILACWGASRLRRKSQTA